MPRLRLIAVLLAWASALPAAAQPLVTSPAPDRVEVTVYRDPGRGEEAMRLQWLNGFALVSERRRVRLPAGESVVRFEGVAGGIVPQSAIVTGFPDGIMERNRDAYLLSPATLIDRSLGRRVLLRRTSLATGAVREQEAEIRSGADGALVVQTAEGVETLRCTGLRETLVYDGVPAGLSARPTLSVRVQSSAAVDAEVTLSYLATGFDWEADYVAELAPDGRRLRLFAWLTLASQDETSFRDADAQAVAGRLNYTRAPVPPAEGRAISLRCWPRARTSDIPLTVQDQDEESFVVTGSRLRRAEMMSPAPVVVVSAHDLAQRGVAVQAEQEELGDLKLYRIPVPVTVAANSQKQVALMVRDEVEVATVYRARMAPGTMDEPQPARRVLVTRNREQEGLGLPLPAGSVALFMPRDGQRFLSGRGRLDDRAVGEDVEIDFGAAPGVTAQMRRLTPDAEGRADYELVVRSDRSEPVRFEAELVRPSGSRIVTRTRLGERDGYPLWRATVPANGMVRLIFTMRPGR